MKGWFASWLGKESSTTAVEEEEEVVNNNNTKYNRPKFESNSTTMETSKSTPSDRIKELVCLDQPLSEIISNHPEASRSKVMQTCQEILQTNGEDETANQLVQRKVIAYQLLHHNDNPVPDIKINSLTQDKVQTVITRLRETGMDNATIEKICSKSNFDSDVKKTNLPTPPLDIEPESADPAVLVHRKKWVQPKWTPKEDKILWTKRIKQGLDWDDILPFLNQRSVCACEHRINQGPPNVNTQESNLEEELEDKEQELSSLPWTKEEDDLLWELKTERKLAWSQIYPHFNHRKMSACQTRFYRILPRSMKKQAHISGSSNREARTTTKFSRVSSNRIHNPPAKESLVGKKWTAEDEALLWEEKIDKKQGWDRLLALFQREMKLDLKQSYGS